MSNAVSIYLLKVVNRNTRARCEICSKFCSFCVFTKRRQWCRFGVFIVNFERSFLTFLWCIEMWHWTKMGLSNQCKTSVYSNCYINVLTFNHNWLKNNQFLKISQIFQSHNHDSHKCCKRHTKILLLVL